MTNGENSCLYTLDQFKLKSDFIFLFLQSWKKKKSTTQSKALLEVKAVGEGFYIHGKKHELQTKH